MMYNKYMKNQVKRFNNAFSGIWKAIVTDSNFRWQVIGGLSLFSVYWVVDNVTETQTMFLILSYFLILITELQNTSVEAALDKIHPEHHHEIGKSKDMMAGSVLLSGIFSLIVIIWVVI